MRMYHIIITVLQVPIQIEHLFNILEIFEEMNYMYINIYVRFKY